MPTVILGESITVCCATPADFEEIEKMRSGKPSEPVRERAAFCAHLKPGSGVLIIRGSEMQGFRAEASTSSRVMYFCFRAPVTFSSEDPAGLLEVLPLVLMLSGDLLMLCEVCGMPGQSAFVCPLCRQGAEEFKASLRSKLSLEDIEQRTLASQVLDLD